ncbi:MAG: ATP-binding protein [Actinomycetota bacterium]
MTVPRAEPAPTAPELELEFPPKPEFVRLARHAVAALGRLHEAPADVVDDIKLAVSEACTTAVLSSAAAAAQDPIHVSALADSGRMLIEVVDPASGLLREVIGSPTELDTEDLPFERMLSLPVIRGLVDEVAVAPNERGGVAVRMVVSLGGPGG